MNKINTVITILFYIVIGALLIFGIVRVNKFYNRLDTERTQWADLYEECVNKQYGVSPATFYQKNGEYPECDIRLIKNIN